jgi:urease accessory protein
MPTTLLEGLLTGITHPAAGLDHLTFMIAIGLAAALTPTSLLVITAFATSSLVGNVVHAANFDFAYSEQLVAISVILAGLLLLMGYGSKRSIWLPFALIAGLAHGYAFGETILGANRDVTAVYIAAVLGVVVAITVAVMLAVSKGLKFTNAESIPVRAAGGIAAAIGIYLFIGFLHGDSGSRFRFHWLAWLK